MGSSIVTSRKQTRPDWQRYLHSCALFNWLYLVAASPMKSRSRPESRRRRPRRNGTYGCEDRACVGCSCRAVYHRARQKRPMRCASAPTKYSQSSVRCRGFLCSVLVASSQQKSQQATAEIVKSVDRLQKNAVCSDYPKRARSPGQAPPSPASRRCASFRPSTITVSACAFIASSGTRST